MIKHPNCRCAVIWIEDFKTNEKPATLPIYAPKDFQQDRRIEGDWPFFLPRYMPQAANSARLDERN